MTETIKSHYFYGDTTLNFFRSVTYHCDPLNNCWIIYLIYGIPLANLATYICKYTIHEKV
jgi:hypothetical protein